MPMDTWIGSAGTEEEAEVEDKKPKMASPWATALASALALAIAPALAPVSSG